MTRYIFLALENRENRDWRSVNDGYYALCALLEDSSFSFAFELILSLLFSHFAAEKRRIRVLPYFQHIFALVERLPISSFSIDENSGSTHTIILNSHSPTGSSTMSPTWESLKYTKAQNAAIRTRIIRTTIRMTQILPPFIFSFFFLPLSFYHILAQHTHE